MANKKKLNLMPKGYEIDNKLMSEMKKKRATIASSSNLEMTYQNLKNN